MLRCDANFPRCTLMRLRTGNKPNPADEPGPRFRRPVGGAARAGRHPAQAVRIPGAAGPVGPANPDCGFRGNHVAFGKALASQATVGARSARLGSCRLADPGARHWPSRHPGPAFVQGLRLDRGSGPPTGRQRAGAGRTAGRQKGGRNTNIGMFPLTAAIGPRVGRGEEPSTAFCAQPLRARPEGRAHGAEYHSDNADVAGRRQ